MNTKWNSIRDQVAFAAVLSRERFAAARRTGLASRDEQGNAY
jgi:hypothetical protein